MHCLLEWKVSGAGTLGIASALRPLNPMNHWLDYQLAKGTEAQWCSAESGKAFPHQAWEAKGEEASGVQALTEQLICSSQSAPCIKM